MSKVQQEARRWVGKHLTDVNDERTDASGQPVCWATFQLRRQDAHRRLAYNDNTGRTDILQAQLLDRLHHALPGLHHPQIKGLRAIDNDVFFMVQLPASLTDSLKGWQQAHGVRTQER